MSEPTIDLRVGDVRERLRELSERSVHAVVTSPPYWALRAYNTEPQVWGGSPDCDHDFGVELVMRARGGGTGKSTLQFDGRNETAAMYGQERLVARQSLPPARSSLCGRCGAWLGELGQEPDPDLFVAHLVEVFREVARVLRDDGVLVVNMDDTHVANRSYQVPSTKAGDVSNPLSMRAPDGLKPKDLALVPARLALALQADGWWIRCDGIWEKPNAMPESVGDRPTRSHEYLWICTKSSSYFWDGEAVKEATADGRDWTLPGGWRMARNMRSVWQVTTESYPDAHFATMAKEVAIRAVLATTSERGCCATCAAPIIRDVERRTVDRHELPRDHPEWRPARYDAGKAGDPQAPGAGQRYVFTRTRGWLPSCSCASPEFRDDDFDVIPSPLGEGGGTDPSDVVGRAGFERPRAEDGGVREITRYEQRMYAEQLRSHPQRSVMEAAVGAPAFAHYIRTDRAGARPVPAALLDEWISCGWLKEVDLPRRRLPELAPCVVLDPFAGAATTLLVSRRLGRSSIGIELSSEFAAIAERRLETWWKDVTPSRIAPSDDQLTLTETLS